MKAILFYFQFFTQIPIHVTIKQADKVYRDGIMWLGVFGGLYMSILGLIYYGLVQFVSVEVAWICTLMCDALLTGGFHQDAFADTIDGVFSSRPREEMLRIMKDSRIGSNGVLALILYYLFLAVAGPQVLAEQSSFIEILQFFFILGLVTRSMLAWAHHHYRYVSHSSKGLGSMLVGISFQRIVIGQLLALVLLFVLYSWQGVVSYAVTLICVELYRRAIYRLLEGMNGDTTGTVCIVATVVYVLTLLIVW